MRMIASAIVVLAGAVFALPGGDMATFGGIVALVGGVIFLRDALGGRSVSDVVRDFGGISHSKKEGPDD